MAEPMCLALQGSDPEPEEAAGAAPQDASAAWAAGSPAESPGSALRHMSEVLEAIFDYYCVRRQDARLTCTRFQRMAVDSCIVGGRLPSAKVDITFSQICGNSPYMNLQQFRDAIVRLATLKFPELSTVEAVLKVYGENLSAFEGSAELEGAFSAVPPDALLVFARARPSLQVLYEGYFPAEVSRNVAKRTSTVAMSEAQASFLQLLGDFEVVPDLVPKAVAHAIFRDVAKTRSPPESFWQSLLDGGDQGAAAPRRCHGRVFSFAHLAAALALAAARCFVNEGGGAVRKLLEWMDSSKGRVIFASSCPGVLAAGASIRLAPERPAGWSRRGASPLSAAELAAAARGGPSPSGTPASLVASDSFVGAEVDTPDYAVGGSSPSTPPCILGSGGGASLARQRSASLRGANALAVQSLSGAHRKLAQQVFMHYVALGDPLNRASMSSMKFNRFLRDAGLLSSEVSASSSGSAFDPRQRRKTVAGDESELSNGRRRSSSTGSMASARRYSVSSARRPSSRNGAVQADALGTARRSLGLPLCVFAQPPLSSVDADLVFVHALRGEGQEAEQTSARKGLGVAQRFGMGMAKAEQRPKGRFLDFDGFCRALVDVAGRCAAYRQAGCGGEGTPLGSKAFERFCEELLSPLSSALGGSQSEDLQRAVRALEDPAILEVLGRNDRSLGNIFQMYSSEGGGQGRHWTTEALSRFVEDLGITSELSNLPLQKMFKDCILNQDSDESAPVASATNAASQLNFRGFRMLVVMIAQKLTIAQAYQRPVDRLLLLFNGMNTMVTTGGLSGRFAPQQDLLLHVPRPTRSASAPRLESAARPGSLPLGGAGGGRRSGRRSSAAVQPNGSWAVLLAAQQG